jgi:hypothetical protein
MKHFECRHFNAIWHLSVISHLLHRFDWIFPVSQNLHCNALGHCWLLTSVLCFAPLPTCINPVHLTCSSTFLPPDCRLSEDANYVCANFPHLSRLDLREATAGHLQEMPCTLPIQLRRRIPASKILCSFVYSPIMLFFQWSGHFIALASCQADVVDLMLLVGVRLANYFCSIRCVYSVARHQPLDSTSWRYVGDDYNRDSTLLGAQTYNVQHWMGTVVSLFGAVLYLV